MPKNLTVVCADAHAGLVGETWWLPPEQEETLRRSLEQLSFFLQSRRQEIKQVVFNGDMLHAWRKQYFDPNLAREQLAPVRHALASLQVPVMYIRGNADDEAGQAANPQVIREAFGDPKGQSINLQFPGWTYRDGDTMFVHGHAFDLDPHTLNRLAAVEACLFPAHKRREYRDLLKKILFTPSQSGEMALSLRQAMRGEYHELLFLANRSNKRHGSSSSLYRFVRKIPLVRLLAEHLKEDVAKHSVHGAALHAVSQYNTSAEAPIERLVLSHTHIPAIWDTAQVREESLAEDLPNMPQQIINTGTVTGRSLKGVATVLMLRDEEHAPELYRLYDPKRPFEEIVPMQTR